MLDDNEEENVKKKKKKTDPTKNNHCNNYLRKLTITTLLSHDLCEYNDISE